MEKDKPSDEPEKPKRKRRTKAEIEQEELEEEEQYRKWVQTFADMLKGVPKELWFGMFLSWLWAQTHNSNIPNKGDLILGLLGGFTLPHALRASALSPGSVWAGVYLAALGYNYFNDDTITASAGDLLLAVSGPSGIGQALADAFVDATERDPVHATFEAQTIAAGGIYHRAYPVKFPGIPYWIVPPKAEMPPGTHEHGDKTIYWRLEDWYNCTYRVGGVFNFRNGTCPMP